MDTIRSQQGKGCSGVVRTVKSFRTALGTDIKRLKKWCDLDITPNQAIWDIEKFEQGDITEDDLNRLKHTLDILRKETEEERQDNASALRTLKKQEKSISDELKELKRVTKRIQKKFWMQDMNYRRN